MQNHSRIFFSLVLIPSVVMLGQLRLTVSETMPLPGEGHHIWRDSTVISWSSRQVFLENTSFYSTENSIRSVVPLPIGQVGIVEETSQDYLLRIVDQHGTPVFTTTLDVAEDYGFPRIATLPDGTPLLLNAVEQKIGIGGTSPSLQWFPLRTEDRDHEKQLLTTSFENDQFFLGMPQAAPGNRLSVLYTLKHHSRPVAMDSISLSLPYYFFPFLDQLAIIGSDFSNDYSPENRLILYNPKARMISAEVPLPTIPGDFRVKDQKLYLIYNDRLEILNHRGQILTTYTFPALVPVDVAINDESIFIIGGRHPDYIAGQVVYDTAHLLRISNQIDEYFIQTDGRISGGRINRPGKTIILLANQRLLQILIPD